VNEEEVVEVDLVDAPVASPLPGEIFFVIWMGVFFVVLWAMIQITGALRKPKVRRDPPPDDGSA